MLVKAALGSRPDNAVEVHLDLKVDRKLNPEQAMGEIIILVFV